MEAKRKTVTIRFLTVVVDTRFMLAPLFKDRLVSTI